MKNYLQAGDNLTVPAPADVNAGDGVLIGAMFGVAVSDALTGALVTIVRKGAFSLPKTAAQAWSLGAKLYWDGANGACTTTATGNTLIGFVGAAAADADVTGVAVLDGAAATT